VVGLERAFARANPGDVKDHVMKSRKSFLLRINPDLYEALEAWARQELRSINGQIEYIIKEAVRKRGKNISDNEAETADDAENET
jgi:hypothetical protein